MKDSTAIVTSSSRYFEIIFSPTIDALL